MSTVYMSIGVCTMSIVYMSIGVCTMSIVYMSIGVCTMRPTSNTSYWWFHNIYSSHYNVLKNV